MKAKTKFRCSYCGRGRARLSGNPFTESTLKRHITRVHRIRGWI